MQMVRGAGPGVPLDTLWQSAGSCSLAGYKTENPFNYLWSRRRGVGAWQRRTVFPEHSARDVGAERQRGETTLVERRMREQRCFKDAKWRLKEGTNAGDFSSRPSSHQSFITYITLISDTLPWCRSPCTYSQIPIPSSSLPSEMITLSLLFLNSSCTYGSLFSAIASFHCHFWMLPISCCFWILLFF